MSARNGHAAKVVRRYERDEIAVAQALAEQQLAEQIANTVIPISTISVDGVLAQGPNGPLPTLLFSFAGPGGPTPRLAFSVEHVEDLVPVVALLEGAVQACRDQLAELAATPAEEPEEVTTPSSTCDVCGKKIFGDLIATGHCTTCAPPASAEDRDEIDQVRDFRAPLGILEPDADERIRAAIVERSES